MKEPTWWDATRTKKTYNICLVSMYSEYIVPESGIAETMSEKFIESTWRKPNLAAQEPMNLNVVNVDHTLDVNNDNNPF